MTCACVQHVSDQRSEEGVDEAGAHVDQPDLLGGQAQGAREVALEGGEVPGARG